MHIINQLNKIRQDNRIGLMTHLVAGYPDLQTSELLIEMMAKYVDFIEIQIPFSDPMADGPVIMASNQKALDQGIRVKDSFNLMSKMSRKVKIPLLFMGYFNTIFNYGVAKFCGDAAKAGCSGLIIPDITLEEGEDYFANCKKYKLDHIFVVAPNTPPERLKLINKKASGFVYCMARAGVTGSKTDIGQQLANYLQRVKKYIKIPLAVGFGIQSREQIELLKGKADIAVIGSELIRRMEGKKGMAAVKSVEEFLKNL